MDWISPRTPRKTKHKFINLKEIITRNHICYALFAGCNLGKKIGKFGVFEIFPKTEYERSLLITQRDEEFVFPFGRWFSKIIRKNYKFRELTLRRESTVRTENFSGESHGDREEFQLEEKKR